MTVLHIDLEPHTSAQFHLACGKTYKVEKFPPSMDAITIQSITQYDTDPRGDICKSCLKHPDVQLHLLTLVG